MTGDSTKEPRLCWACKNEVKDNECFTFITKDSTRVFHERCLPVNDRGHVRLIKSKILKILPF